MVPTYYSKYAGILLFPEDAIRFYISLDRSDWILASQWLRCASILTKRRWGRL